MRRFYFDRQTDVSGTSGTGAVVEGVQFSDGSVYLRWMTSLTSWAHYRSIEECVLIHGHGGATNLVWVDEVPSEPSLYASRNVRWFRIRGSKVWHRASGHLIDAPQANGMIVTVDVALCHVAAKAGSTHIADPKGRRCKICSSREPALESA